MFMCGRLCLVIYIIYREWMVSFLTRTVLHCQFRGIGQGMKKTYLYLWYPLFQARWDRFEQQNIFSERTSSLIKITD
jgi:hypothetical protein